MISRRLLWWLIVILVLLLPVRWIYNKTKARWVAWRSGQNENVENQPKREATGRQRGAPSPSTLVINRDQPAAQTSFATKLAQAKSGETVSVITYAVRPKEITEINCPAGCKLGLNITDSRTIYLDPNGRATNGVGMWIPYSNEKLANIGNFGFLNVKLGEKDTTPVIVEAIFTKW